MGNRKHIPIQVKEKIVTMSHLHKTTIARNLQCSRNTVHNVLRLAARTGSVVRTPLFNGERRLLNSVDLTYIESLIERTPDIYLREIQEELLSNRGIEVSVSCISTSIHRRGYTRKKLSVPAAERNEGLRAEFRDSCSRNFMPEQLVFVDESHTNRITSRRRYGWAPAGDRSRRRDCFVRGRRFSVLPAISLSGVLHLTIQERPYTAADFTGFVDALLDQMDPFPGPNSVLVMDNASIHKSQQMVQMVQARGMRLLYLPAYSPDLNPIEEGFSCFKAWLRANRDYVRAELDVQRPQDTYSPYLMLWDAVFSSITQEKIEGWYMDCGYT